MKHLKFELQILSFSHYIYKLFPNVSVIHYFQMLDINMRRNEYV